MQISFGSKVEFFQVENQAEQIPTNLHVESSFPIGVFCSYTVSGLVSSQERRISLLKWVLPVLTWIKLKNSLEALLQEFSKNNAVDKWFNARLKP